MNCESRKRRCIDQRVDRVEVVNALCCPKIEIKAPISNFQLIQTFDQASGEFRGGKAGTVRGAVRYTVWEHCVSIHPRSRHDVVPADSTVETSMSLSMSTIRPRQELELGRASSGTASIIHSSIHSSTHPPSLWHNTRWRPDRRCIHGRP